MLNDGKARKMKAKCWKDFFFSKCRKRTIGKETSASYLEEQKIILNFRPCSNCLSGGFVANKSNKATIQNGLALCYAPICKYFVMLNRLGVHWKAFGFACRSERIWNEKTWRNVGNKRGHKNCSSKIWNGAEQTKNSPSPPPQLHLDKLNEIWMKIEIFWQINALKLKSSISPLVP